MTSVVVKFGGMSMSVRIGIALVVGLMIGSAPISAVAGGGGGGDDEKRDTVGEVRSAKWYLRSSNDPACTAAATVFNYGTSTDTFLAADPDGDGLDQATVFRTSDGYGLFYIRANNDSGDQASTLVAFGAVGDLPVIGDFDTTSPGDEVGVYRPSNSRFYLQNGDGSVTSFGKGVAGDVPVAGNWDASEDGSDEVGLWRSSNNSFYLLSANSSGASTLKRPIGTTDDLPVTGDWDRDGSATIGVFRDATRGGKFYLNNMTTGSGAEFSFSFGDGSGAPVAGDWDGPAVDEAGCGS
jgi:hypothetical protein